MFSEIITYFQTLEQHPLHRMAFLVVGLLFFWIIEGSIPLLKLNYKKTKLKHASVNFAFTLIHLLIHTFLAIIIVLLSDWCLQYQFGLVYWLNAGTILTIILVFLTLDFFAIRIGMVKTYYFLGAKLLFNKCNS